MRPYVLAVACLVWAVAQITNPRAAQIAASDAAAAHPGVEFDTSDNCFACHNGLVTPGGEDVSIGVHWRASMMANASRDPYWQASVRRETIDHPSKKGVIEDECSICHMPMARTSARATGRLGEVFRLLPLTPPRSNEHRLAADGVACSLCHQIGPDRLGTRESFVGGFVIERPGDGGRRMSGPFEVDKGHEAVMRSATNVRPGKADHIRSAELCATCHTLYTEAFDDKGAVVGSLPEQVPYLEWRNSRYAGEKTCQACHMPPVQSTAISSVLGQPRDQWGRHAFLGGNFFMLRMLNRYRAQLGVEALPTELDSAAHATIRQLQTDTATVGISRAEIRAGRLEADVVVRNLAGHKLPTGYPSRRAWLHLTVRDGTGRTVFESGGVTETGSIRGNDNDADPLRFEPHYVEISSSEQVQIYESIMGDAGGVVTTGLLKATAFLKDNRLLPLGFDKATADRDIAVIGAASQDTDFDGNGDVVRFVIELAGAPAPFEVEVDLRFQPISFRWAENLRRYDSAESRRFVSFYQSMAASSSISVARNRTTVR